MDNQRFVILRHATPGGYERSQHWDLMLENDKGTLQTWALTECPAPGATILADELPPHRIEYLEYEGPIAGGRGDVVRVFGGHYTVDDRGDVLLFFTHEEKELQWRLRVTSTGDATWCEFAIA